MTEQAPGGAAAATLANATAAALPGTQPAGTSEPAAFDWKGALGDGYQAHEKLIQTKGWKGPGDVLASYNGLEKRVGEGIKLPGAEAKPEEWDAFWAKMGRPEKSDGYQFQKPEGFEGYDDQFAGTFRDAAHKAGLNAKQAAALHDWWVGQSKQRLADLVGSQEQLYKQRKADTDAWVDKAWGAKKAETEELARRAYSQALQETGLSAEQAAADMAEFEALSKNGNRILMWAFGKLGEGLREAGLHNGQQLQADAGARSEIAALEADPKFREAWLTKGHPGHDEAVRRMTDLQQRAHPNAIGQAPGRAA